MSCQAVPHLQSLEGQTGHCQASVVAVIIKVTRSLLSIKGVPEIRGIFLGVPITRVIVCWGQYWGPLFRETTI